MNSVNDNTCRLLSKLIIPSNTTLADDILNAVSHKRAPKVPSTIQRCLTFAETHNIPITPQRPVSSRRPPWEISTASFNTTLMEFPKNTTPNRIYENLYREAETTFKSTGWTFLFTDGSKSSEMTSFAAIKENGDIIKHGLLLPFCSVFTAEASAILQASVFAKSNKGKFIICTDSKSCIIAIQSPHNHNHIISSIRDILICCSRKIKIMWIPGHIGIHGNELADSAAKNVLFSPVLTSASFAKNDIRMLISHLRHRDNTADWSSYKHHYKIVNPDYKNTIYPATLSCSYIRPFTRLRLGHTMLTHAHLLQASSPSSCPICGGTSSVQHFLISCPRLIVQRKTIFDEISALDVLKNPNIDNIIAMYNFLKESKLLHLI